jgi:hypothetical protein
MANAANSLCPSTIWPSVDPTHAPATPEAPKTSAQRRLHNAWVGFVDRLWGKKDLVLYAQRHELVKWFDFDPADANYLDETNRPWDYDHIHADSYVSGRHSIPQLIKDWHGSVGNIRAWPMRRASPF